MKTNIVVALFLALSLAASAVHANSLDLSIAIRETGGSGPAFSNAGSSGGIEWVNRDGQSLVMDGTWQQFTFTPSTDTLLAFAGDTANSVLDTDWVSLEHIRILNSQGITTPVRIWIDNVSNTTSAGTVTEGFESFAVGSEVIFQEAGFSGSTSANVAAGSISAVTDSTALAGDQSYQVDFQFVDNTPTRWIRLTTFPGGTMALPNPAFLARETGFAPTISFWAKAWVIPEPSTAVLLGLAGMGLVGFRKR